MGSYMHLLCEETGCSVEAWKCSASGKELKRIECGEDLVDFLHDHNGEVIKVVWDGCLHEYDSWQLNRSYEDGFRLNGLKRRK